MTQQKIIDNCKHEHKPCQTRHGDICVDCYQLYYAAKPKRKRAAPRQRVTAYGDYAIFAALNGRLNG